MAAPGTMENRRLESGNHSPNCGYLKLYSKVKWDATQTVAQFSVFWRGCLSRFTTTEDLQGSDYLTLGLPRNCKIFKILSLSS